jgi:hypothetical protein
MCIALVDRYDWRYLPTGKSRHALQDVEDVLAVCGIPGTPWWLGTGSQAEYERLAGLPMCLRCLRIIGPLL